MGNRLEEILGREVSDETEQRIAHLLRAQGGTEGQELADKLFPPPERTEEDAARDAERRQLEERLAELNRR